jgi:cation transport regulator
MPYASNQNLPDTVKRNLPEGAQSIYRNAFNSAFEKNNDDEKSAQIAWGAVKNAGWEKNDKGEWIKMNTELKDVEIFSTGTWAGETFNEADLDELVTNFHKLKDKIKPPLKIAHKNAMHKQDGQPALGWATEIKRVGQKLLATFTDVPEMIRTALEKRLYKRVSSEIYNNLSLGGEKYKRALAGVGLLGADIPEVKNLRDIEIFFTDQGEIKRYDLDVENGVINYTEGKNEMDEKLMKNYEERIKLLEEENNRIKTEKKTENETEIKKYTDEIEKLKAMILASKKEATLAEFTSFCEKAVTEGKMFPAARDILIDGMGKMEFSEGQEISIPFGKFKEYIEKSKEILDKTERGMHLSTQERGTVKKTYTDKPGVVFDGSTLDAEARKYMAEHKVEYIEAVQAVMENSPELFNEFSNAGFSGKEA